MTGDEEALRQVEAGLNWHERQVFAELIRQLARETAVPQEQPAGRPGASSGGCRPHPPAPVRPVRVDRGRVDRGLPLPGTLRRVVHMFGWFAVLVAVACSTIVAVAWLLWPVALWLGKLMPGGGS